MRKAASAEAASGTGRNPGKARRNSDMGFPRTASGSIIRPSGPAAQRPSGPAAQRPSGPAAQRPSGPSAPRGDRLPRLAHWRPDAPAGRARARRLRPLPVLALLLAALSPLAAAPAAADVLVSNLGQTRVSATLAQTASLVISTGFTTGSESGGYTLSSIESVWGGGADSTQRGTIRAELWSDDGGEPDEKVADLTVPSTVAAGTVAFAAPSNAPTLTASTTYHFVVYTVGTFSPGLAITNSDSEDSSGATGWTIANAAGFSVRDTPSASMTWGTNSAGNSLAIRVNGSAVTAPDAPTGLTVTPGDAELTVSWTAPSGTVTGYDVHYTSNATVAAGAAVQAGAASVGWKAHPSRTATDTSPRRRSRAW